MKMTDRNRVRGFCRLEALLVTILLEQSAGAADGLAYLHFRQVWMHACPLSNEFLSS
jgi:hypothetical protein